jgi:hypothetical protein
MALPSKKNIDFNVYERQDPTTQVDWGAQATKITETFEGIRDERQGRKDLLEKNIEEQRVALNDIGEYDSQNLRQLALKSSQQSAEELARKAALMRAGKIKPNELMQFKSNQSAGWTLFKKNAESWNGKFVEYTERMNAVPPLSSKLEQQLAQSLAGFGNLENMSYLTDDDGNMSYVRTDEAGNIIPGESISANELTNLLNQKIDNYDSVAAAKSAGEKIGTIVTEILEENGINATISSDARSKAESDYFGSEAAAEVLRKYADTMTAVPQNLAVMLTQNVNIPDTKTVYEGDYGGKLHDAWAKENADKDQSLNPYIAMRMKSGTYVADVTEEQKAVATEYAEGLIRSTLNIKKGVDTKGMNQKKEISAAEIAKGERDAKLLSKGKNLMYAVSGDEKKSAAGIQYLVDASNGNISGMQKTDTGFIVQYPDADPFPVNTEGMSPIESMRAMWKSAGLQDDEFDAWLTAGGADLLEGRETTRDVQDVKGPQKAIVYDPQAKIILKSGKEGSAVDRIVEGPLGKSPSVWEANTNAEFISEYQNLLNDEAFFPKGIGAGKVTFDTSKEPDEMIITIGGTPYNIGPVFEMNTTETVAAVQEKIQEAIDARKDKANLKGDGTGSKYPVVTEEEVK